MKQRGSSVDAGTLLNRLIHTTPELTDGHYQEMFVPVGPWKKGAAIWRPADVSVREREKEKTDAFCDRLHPGRDAAAGNDRDFDATEHESA